MIDQLEAYLKQFGFRAKLRGGKLQKKLTQALKEFAQTPKEPILNILVLRAMSQAQYTEENVGHFGLAFKDYTHFTSPIRRYPDLMVHRTLKASQGVAQGTSQGASQGEAPLAPSKSSKKGAVTEKKSAKKKSAQKKSKGRDLGQAGTWLSACEQRSVKAERQLISIKKARFMEAHLGREFDGFISSVAKFGVFVVLRAFDVDGLVRIEDLPGDRYRFDEKNLCLVGSKTGRSYGLSDPMRIQVAAVDCQEGKIDFLPVDHQSQ